MKMERAHVTLAEASATIIALLQKPDLPRITGFRSVSSHDRKRILVCCCMEVVCSIIIDFASDKDEAIDGLRALMSDCEKRIATIYEEMEATRQ